MFLPVPKWHYTILHQTVLRSSHVDMLLTREDAPRQSLRLSQAASTSDNTWVDDKTSRKNQKYKSNVSPRIHDSPSVSLHSSRRLLELKVIVSPFSLITLTHILPGSTGSAQCCRSNQHLSPHVGPCCPSSNAMLF